MQEEVTGKSIALIVSSAKMTEQVLDRAIRAYLNLKKHPKIYRGKQTLKQLAGQNAGLSNIEITEKNIRCFTQTAKKYHVDFALKKDTTSEQPRYLVFFKSRDADAITAAFQEFTARKHLTGTVIYGYLWNEARDQWLVDPEAAEVVKRIFAMTIDGYGPYQIASKLKEEKVLIPSAYLARHGEGVNKNKTFKDVYGWGSSTWHGAGLPCSPCEPDCSGRGRYQRGHHDRNGSLDR